MQITLQPQFQCFCFEFGAQVPEADAFTSIPEVINGVAPHGFSLSNDTLNFTELLGIPKTCGQEALVFNEFEASAEGRATLGFSADWWMQIAINGSNVYDTFQQGNGSPLFSPDDHIVSFDVRKGRNLLVAKVRSGIGSWRFVVGKPTQCEYTGVNAVDLNAPQGRLRPELHGTNSSPNFHSRGNFDPLPMLKDMNFTSARTHDWALCSPGTRIIDTFFLFPLEGKDPGDPGNYYFESTDVSVKLMLDAGIDVFYRLGTSIEHSGNMHINSNMPKDFNAYAEVCAGIIRHYTRGWANGFHYNMKYWEIWNEPDLGGHQCWNGTFAEFIKLFIIVFKRLKAEFPELEIGGPALCGPDFGLMEQFFPACREAGVEPDFFSWHSYSTSVRNIARQPGEVRKRLDAMGFTNTKLVLDEWHYLTNGAVGNNGEEYKRFYTSPHGVFGIDSAAFNVGVISAWHDTPLDMGYYYGCAIYGTWGYFDLYREYNLNYYSMCALGGLFRNYASRFQAISGMPNIFLLGGISEDGNRAQLLVTDFCGEDMEVELQVKNAWDFGVSVTILDQTRKLEPASFEFNGEKLLLKKQEPGSAVFVVNFEKRQ